MKHKLIHCEKFKSAVVIFLLILLTQQSNAQMIESADDNDNLKYFHDIAIETGAYTPIDNSFSGGNVVTLSGSHYWNDKWGLRSGLSFITAVEGSDKYFKIPVLFSFRTKTFVGVFEDKDVYDNFGEFLLNFILQILPTRFELNAGASLGYITPAKSASYIVENGRKSLLSTADVRSRFASSLDVNGRLSFQFWRICVTGNLGLSYLLTNNYDYRIYYPREEKIRCSWFVNASCGLSFRF